MDDDPTAAHRERAREWGRSVLASDPWPEYARRTTLLLVDPPFLEGGLVAEEERLSGWLVVDATDVRTLPEALRGALLRDGNARLAVLDGRVTVFVAEALARLLEGTARRSLEVRWSVAHADPLHDPLRRFGDMAGMAERFSPEAIERIARPLFLQAVDGLTAIASGGAASVLVAGETEGALCRLCCVLDEGSHPPIDWLGAVARGTALGRPIQPWLTDLRLATARDEAALRRVAVGAETVRRVVSEALKLRFAAPDWLMAPETYVFRPPR